MQDLLDAELLRLIKQHGAIFDATDAAGKKPTDLGGKPFKTLVLLPDYDPFTMLSPSRLLAQPPHEEFGSCEPVVC